MMMMMMMMMMIYAEASRSDARQLIPFDLGAGEG